MPNGKRVLESMKSLKEIMSVILWIILAGASIAYTNILISSEEKIENLESIKQ